MILKQYCYALLIRFFFPPLSLKLSLSVDKSEHLKESSSGYSSKVLRSAVRDMKQEVSWGQDSVAVNPWTLLVLVTGRAIPEGDIHPLHILFFLSLLPSLVFPLSLPPSPSAWLMALTQLGNFPLHPDLLVHLGLESGNTVEGQRVDIRQGCRWLGSSTKWVPNKVLDRVPHSRSGFLAL